MNKKLELKINYIKSKGFIIKDESLVIEYLEKIGLYRLSKYFINFRNEKNIDFKEVINHYLFDAELRSLTLLLLEHIENSLKSQFVLHIGDEYNNPEIYIENKKEERISFISEKKEFLLKNDIKLKGEKHIFISSEFFINKLTFGEIFKFFSDLKKEYKYNIINYYGINSLKVFENWIYSLRYMRNLCSHGENVFNRRMSEWIRGKQISRTFNLTENNNFISFFSVISIFNKILNINQDYEEKLFYNIEKYNIDFKLLGQKKSLPQCASLRGMEGLLLEVYSFYIKKSKDFVTPNVTLYFKSSLLPNMPKLESPFVRKMIDEEYVVTSEITIGYEWVFEDHDVICMEKLDGTNICIEIKDKKPIKIQNRLNKINFWDKSKIHIIEGIYESFNKGYLDLSDGVYFGELIGPKLQGNPYDLDKHIWVPFLTYTKEFLAYKSWGKYDVGFESISKWFKGDDIFSLYYRKIHKGVKKKPEGIIFYSPSKNKLAKLRLDMFDWYEGKKHKF